PWKSIIKRNFKGLVYEAARADSLAFHEVFRDISARQKKSDPTVNQILSRKMNKIRGINVRTKFYRDMEYDSNVVGTVVRPLRRAIAHAAALENSSEFLEFMMRICWKQDGQFGDAEIKNFFIDAFRSGS